MKLENIHIVYFIGIGGIGMSALARYFNQLGCEVHGYDRTASRITKELTAEGMQIHYEDDVQYIPKQVDIVIYTPAVPQSHTELTWFREQGYPVKKRAEVLGIISRSKKAIAVAGTHGKTTTTSIITHLLRFGGIDCTAFLGGIAGNLGSNFVFGESDWVVVEADEYDRSFLHLNPYYSIITSTDADHLDIYGDADSMLDSYTAFAEKNTQGKVFLKEGLRLKSDNTNIYTDAYGVAAGFSQAKNIRVEDGFFVFDFRSQSEQYPNIDNIKFTLPGRHNIENATSAIIVALELGLSAETIKEALASFKGIWRRFETLVRDDDFVYIDDYAHHPSELKAAIGAARELYPHKRITGIFQPHLFTRTRDFVDGFAAALDGLDELLLLDIYPARELPIEGVRSEIILDKMKIQNKRMVSKENLLAEVKLSSPEVLLTLGAGDIDRFTTQIQDLYKSV